MPDLHKRPLQTEANISPQPLILLAFMKNPWLCQWGSDLVFSSFSKKEEWELSLRKCMKTVPARLAVQLYSCYLLRERHSTNSLNSSNMLQLNRPVVVLSEASTLQLADNWKSVSFKKTDSFFSFSLTSVEHASFPQKAPNSHFKIRPSVIFVFKH